jgi:IclR family mhp operon transcriptional activator
VTQETVRGLERGLSVLAALERYPGLSLRDLHRETRLPKPTLLRILGTLEANGYARRRIDDGIWRRTARGQPEPSTVIEALLLDVGCDVLDEFCRRVIWPSDLAVYRDGAMQILESSRRLTPFLINRTGVGLRVPVLQSGLGLAWLAFCPDEDRAEITARLAASNDPFDRPARDPAYVDSLVAATRAKGYGIRAKGYQPRRSMSEEKTCGIAVPVYARGRVVAVINLVWILSAFDEEGFVALYLSQLTNVAAKIGRRIEAGLAQGSA